MAKETVPHRRYTDEFKLEALRLAESVGINQTAKRLGMPSSSLGNWARLSARASCKHRRVRHRLRVRRQSSRRRIIGCVASWRMPSWIWRS